MISAIAVVVAFGLGVVVGAGVVAFGVWKVAESDGMAALLKAVTESSDAKARSEALATVEEETCDHEDDDGVCVSHVTLGGDMAERLCSGKKENWC